MIRNLYGYFDYTTHRLAEVRRETNSKVCYRQSLEFLKLKPSLTKSLANRLTHRSAFTSSYRLLRFFYIRFLRANFSLKKSNSETYTFKTQDYQTFLIIYQKYFSMNDFDRILWWRGSQLNTLFKVKFFEKKKKKLLSYQTTILYLPPHKRLAIVWKWLNLLIRTFAVKGYSRTLSWIPPLENFLVTSPESHAITKLKLQIYKLKLLRTV